MDSDQKPREEVSKDSDNEKIKLDTQLDNPSAENSAVETNGATECSTVDLPGLQKPKKKASGPRTPLGKATSSRNATSHGIFAAVLLPGESRSEYKKRYAARAALYSGLTDYRNNYAVTHDGQRFLVNTLDERAGQKPFTAIVNWQSLLQR
jgi:hypothetical protein